MTDRANSVEVSNLVAREAYFSSLYREHYLKDELRLISSESRYALALRFGLIINDQETFRSLADKMGLSPTTARNRFLEGFAAVERASARMKVFESGNQ